MMRLYAILPAVIALLQHEGKITYQALKHEFEFDDDFLALVRNELIFKGIALDDQGLGLVGIGEGPGFIHAAPAVVALPGQDPVETAVVIAPQIQVPESPERPHNTFVAERRQLTVMFCDLVGSTDLSTRLDPEDLREVVRAYQESAAQVINSYGGHIAQYLGDGLLIYFGFPGSHEDDANRALYTGLGILEALDRLNTSLETVHGVRLAVRIGIHTGPVVVGEMGGGTRHENLALGETPNIAARLIGLAEPNTIVITYLTARLVGEAFAMQTMGKHKLKGIGESVEVWQVRGLRETERMEEMVPDEGTSFLIGRDEETGLLNRRWVQSKEGVGQVVLITGEAGIGKSSLVSAIRSRVAKEGSLRITYRCSQYHKNSALYPVIEHLQRMLGFEPDDTAEVKLEKLERGLQPYNLVIDETVPLFADLFSITLPEGRFPAVTLPPQRKRQQTLDALAAWLLEEAERQPTLVLWEDLHWADPTSLEFLGSLIDQIPTVSMLTVLTFRPEFIPPWPLRSHMTPLTLNRLERPHVEVMVTRLCGGKRMPAEVVVYIVNKTDGVPLFVEELTKSFLEADMLEEKEDHYLLSGLLTDVAIPATLNDSLMARLDRLPMVRELAQLGAVFGREFAYEKLQALSTIDEQTLQKGLAQLVDTELLYRRGRAERATYIFKHALVQDAAYHSLLRRTRQQCHKKVAELLITRFPDVVETEPEVVAHHFTEAGDPEPAALYWYKAGDRASRRSANLEAVEHLSKGLEVLQNLPDSQERSRRELDIRMILGPALIAAKGYVAQEVEAVYTRALEQCEQLEASAERFVVMRGLEVHYLVRGQLSKARGFGEQLLDLAQGQEDTALLIGANHALGQSLYFLGNLDDARAHVEQGMTLYRPQQHRFPNWPGGHPGEQCFLYGAWTLWLLGYPDQALQKSREALTLIKELSHPFSLASALDFTALLHQLRGEAPEAQERSENAMELCTEQRITFYLEMGRIIRGWALAVQGQAKEGIAHIKQGLNAIRATGAALWRTHFLAMLAHACKEAGQTEEAFEALEEAFDIMATTRERYYEAEMYRLKGELFRQQPAPDTLQAEMCFKQALAAARSQNARSWELRAAMSLSRLLQQQGKPADARQVLAPVYGWFTEGFDTADLHDAKTLLEEL